MRHATSITAVLLALSLPARPALAGPSWDIDFTPIYPVLVGAPAQLGGLSLSLMATVSAARGARPSRAVLGLGYCVAVMNLGLGAWALAEGMDHDLDFALAFGISGLAVGTFGLIAAAAAHSRPERPAVAVVPLIAPDGAGGMVAGVGLQLTRF